MIRKMLICLAMLGLAACGGGETEETKRQKFAEEVTPGVFESGFFDMTIAPGEGWTAVTYSELAQMLGVGSDLVAGDNAQLKAALESGDARTVPLFGFFDEPLGADVSFNANVLGLGENVRIAPNVEDGKDYFNEARKLFAQSAVPMVPGEGYSTREIGGRVFDQMEVTIDQGTFVVQQNYYARRDGDFVIAIIQSYVGDDQKATTDAVINSIEFGG